MSWITIFRLVFNQMNSKSILFLSVVYLFRIIKRYTAIYEKLLKFGQNMKIYQYYERRNDNQYGIYVNEKYVIVFCCQKFLGMRQIA